MLNMLAPGRYGNTLSQSALLRLLALALSYFIAGCTPTAARSLCTNVVAWFVAAAFAVSRTGGFSALFSNGSLAQRLAASAGILLALATICERAVGEKGLWWAKALLPLLCVVLGRMGILSNSADAVESPVDGQFSNAASAPSVTLLVGMALSGVVAVHSSYVTIANAALGCSFAILQVSALYLIVRACEALPEQRSKTMDEALPHAYAPDGVGVSLKGFALLVDQPWLHVLRDVACAAALTTMCFVLVFEQDAFVAVKYHTPYAADLDQQGLIGRAVMSTIPSISAVMAQCLVGGLLIANIHWQGPFRTSFAPLLATLLVQLLSEFSLIHAWFTSLCVIAILLTFSDELETATLVPTRIKYQPANLVFLFAVLSFLLHILAVMSYRLTPLLSTPADTLDFIPSLTELAPLSLADSSTHPIQQLVQHAKAEWAATLQAQSHDLTSAVAEYKRRYGIAPPPLFDVWFEFAKDRGVKITDDYDSIHDALLPFWGLAPETIRARSREAIGYSDNHLMGVLIRDGQVALLEGGEGWDQEAVRRLLQSFVAHLPDMDLAFNLFDEPRVVVPHEDLSRLVQKGRLEHLRARPAPGYFPPNTFSPRPSDVYDGRRIRESKLTRFNDYARQSTWLPSRLSCPPDSPARLSLDTDPAPDNLTSYAVGDLGFIYNQTAYSDICNTPSMAHTHGFFERPNSFDIIHELFPIFSQSKISSFQDILYPPFWYRSGLNPYDPSLDHPWSEKTSQVWWRGSATGGYSRSGGWRRQHRPRFVRAVNRHDKAVILARPGPNSSSSSWSPTSIPRQDLASAVNVHFTSLGQCDEADCDAMRDAFEVPPWADSQEAWQYKFLLDLDGNAFSGRFYSLLGSASLVLKMAVFREWHVEWLKPWVHYIPLTLGAREFSETVRFLDREPEGQEIAEAMARESQDWVREGLRDEDLEVWFFRLLLEYARVIDDRRTEIGFHGD